MHVWHTAPLQASRALLAVSVLKLRISPYHSSSLFNVAHAAFVWPYHTGHDA
jgi:hypothetical protein